MTITGVVAVADDEGGVGGVGGVEGFAGLDEGVIVGDGGGIVIFDDAADGADIGIGGGGEEYIAENGVALAVVEVAVGGLEDDAFAEEEAEFTGEGLAAVKIVIVGGGEDATTIIY